MNLKKLTIEALAVRSALETMEKLEHMNTALNQAEANLAEANAVTDNMVPINGGSNGANESAGTQLSPGSESVSGR